MGGGFRIVEPDAIKIESEIKIPKDDSKACPTASSLSTILGVKQYGEAVKSIGSEVSSLFDGLRGQQIKLAKKKALEDLQKLKSAFIGQFTDMANNFINKEILGEYDKIKSIWDSLKVPGFDGDILCPALEKGLEVKKKPTKNKELKQMKDLIQIKTP